MTEQEIKKLERPPKDKDKIDKEIQALLRKIRKAIKDSETPLIFRGENKDYGLITSKLYRYFSDVHAQATRQKVGETIRWEPIKQALKAQLGGLLENLNYDDLMKNLKRNVYAQMSQRAKDLMVDKVQKEFILNDVQQYVNYEKEIDILTQLQHYGGSTNLIDFSHDFLVALFFACDGGGGENGRLILFNAKDPDIERPKKNQNNRVISQRSVFVQREDGYIEVDEVEKIVIIPEDLKEGILTYLHNNHGIRTDTMYGDLHGYIQNQEMHRKAYEQFFAGVMYEKVDTYQEAIHCFREAIRLKPNFFHAHHECGHIRSERGEYDLAIDDYSKAIELKRDYFPSYYGRGNAYMGIGDPDSSIADYNEAIALRPDNGDAYYNLGNAYIMKRDYDSAIANYNKAIELGSDNADAYTNRGNAYVEKDDYDHAVADFSKAIELDENHLLAYTNRGNAYKHGGDYIRALYDYEKAIELDRDFAVIYYNRAFCWEKLGNSENAKKNLEIALSLAEEQGEQDLVSQIQQAIDALSKPSNS